jgi:hypothetical protein
MGESVLLGIFAGEGEDSIQKLRTKKDISNLGRPLKDILKKRTPQHHCSGESTNVSRTEDSSRTDVSTKLSLPKVLKADKHDFAGIGQAQVWTREFPVVPDYFFKFP